MMYTIVVAENKKIFDGYVMDLTDRNPELKRSDYHFAWRPDQLRGFPDKIQIVIVDESRIRPGTLQMAIMLESVGRASLTYVTI